MWSTKQVELGRDQSDAPDESVAGTAYADFKVMAAGFWTWVRHAKYLTEARRQRGSNLVKWRRAVAFWHCQTLRRKFHRWLDRSQVYLLHALASWHRSAIRGRFSWWQRSTRRIKWGRVTATAHWVRKTAALVISLWSVYPRQQRCKRNALALAHNLHRKTCQVHKRNWVPPLHP